MTNNLSDAIDTLANVETSVYDNVCTLIRIKRANKVVKAALDHLDRKPDMLANGNKYDRQVVWMRCVISHALRQKGYEIKEIASVLGVTKHLVEYYSRVGMGYSHSDNRAISLLQFLKQI